MHEEFEQPDTSNTTMAFFTGLCAGAVIGAGLGLLWAPRKGSELRRQVSDTANNLGQTVYKTADDFVERGRQWYGKARDAAQRVGDEAERAVNQAAQTAADKIESTANDLSSSVRQTGYRA